MSHYYHDLLSDYYHRRNELVAFPDRCCAVEKKMQDLQSSIVHAPAGALNLADLSVAQKEMDDLERDYSALFQHVEEVVTSLDRLGCHRARPSIEPPLQVAASCVNNARHEEALVLADLAWTGLQELEGKIADLEQEDGDVDFRPTLASLQCCLEIWEKQNEGNREIVFAQLKSTVEPLIQHLKQAIEDWTEGEVAGQRNRELTWIQAQMDQAPVSLQDSVGYYRHTTSCMAIMKRGYLDLLGLLSSHRLVKDDDYESLIGKITKQRQKPEKLLNDLEASIQNNVLGGYRLVSAKGDGNCLFRSLSLCLYGVQSSHDKLRRITHRHLNKNKGDETLKGSLSQEAEELGVSIDEYIRRMSYDRCWSGRPEILAIANCYQRPIVVLWAMNNEKTCGVEVFYPRKQRVAEPLVVQYNEETRHCNAYLSRSVIR